MQEFLGNPAALSTVLLIMVGLGAGSVYFARGRAQELRAVREDIGKQHERLVKLKDETIAAMEFQMTDLRARDVIRKEEIEALHHQVDAEARARRKCQAEIRELREVIEKRTR